jgi:prepilin-type N-terminal cleavage/methylation domain-containing protein
MKTMSWWQVAGGRWQVDRPSEVCVTSRVTHHASRSRSAFTLIEIMIAIGLLSMIIASVYAVWTAILRSSRVGKDTAVAVQRARITVRIIEDSLSSAECFMKNSDYYGFVAENGDEPTLSFVARLAKSFPRSGKFGDLDVRRLEFSIQRGTDTPHELVLRQRPLLMEFDQDEKDHPIILAKNVKAFEMKFYDKDKRPTGDSPDDWPDEWTQTNKLPTLVQVTVRIADNASASSAEEVVTRIVSIPSVQVRPEYQMPPLPGSPGNPNPGGQGNPNPNPNPNPSGGNLNLNPK